MTSWSNASRFTKPVAQREALRDPSAKVVTRTLRAAVLSASDLTSSPCDGAEDLTLCWHGIACERQVFVRSKGQIRRMQREKEERAEQIQLQRKVWAHPQRLAEGGCSFLVMLAAHLALPPAQEVAGLSEEEVDERLGAVFKAYGSVSVRHFPPPQPSFPSDTAHSSLSTLRLRSLTTAPWLQALIEGHGDKMDTIGYQRLLRDSRVLSNG